MTKQEFMAMSLPYELKIQLESGEIVVYNATTYFYDKFNKDIQPILRPLSDLTKPIEHKGEKFVPIVELGIILGFENLSKYEYDGIVEYGWSEKFLDECQGYSFGYYKDGNFGVWLDSIGDTSPIYLHTSSTAILKLIEWHFDIAELIEKGESIDVNTLKINPYK